LAVVKKAADESSPAALLLVQLCAAVYFAAAASAMNFDPFGTPQPVTLSHPFVTFSEVSVPKLRSTSEPPPRSQMALKYAVVVR
jgi:hypothetical protein